MAGDLVAPLAPAAHPPAPSEPPPLLSPGAPSAGPREAPVPRVLTRSWRSFKGTVDAAVAGLFIRRTTVEQYHPHEEEEAPEGHAESRDVAQAPV